VEEGPTKVKKAVRSGQAYFEEGLWLLDQASPPRVTELLHGTCLPTDSF
jgi:hypothetical protein